MSIEYLDDSSGARSGMMNKSSSTKRAEAKANFKKQQNFSLMVQDRRPIGMSGDDNQLLTVN